MVSYIILQLQFLVIEIYKPKNKLNPNFMRKTYRDKKYPIFTEKGYFSLNFKRKGLEIWNKFIKYLRNCILEQLTNKG